MPIIDGTNLVLAHAGYDSPAIYRGFVVQTVWDAIKALYTCLRQDKVVPVTRKRGNRSWQLEAKQNLEHARACHMVVGLKKAATLLTFRLFTPSTPPLLPLGVTFLFFWVCVMLALPCLCMCFVTA